MSDKKIIVVALILAALVIGGGWYYAKHSLPNASISTPQQSTSETNKATEPGIVFGDPNAPVTMEIYTNFLCPACANFALTTFPQIKNNYIATGKVKMVFYIFPPIELGYAALCAQEQGKFIEYHDYVFARQSQITGEDTLKTFAINAGLDGEKFSACYSAAPDKYGTKVNNWDSQGQARTVDSTPTFFINGQKFVGAQPYADFQKLIDQKLNQ